MSEIKKIFYQMRKIAHDDAEHNGYWIVEQVAHDARSIFAPVPLRTVMRGTFDQCQAWLDKRP